MRFQWPKNQGVLRDVTKRQLEWLLEGLQIDQKKAHPDSVDTAGIIY
jgi:transposase